MARLFVQYLAIYNNENLPNDVKFGSIFCQILNKHFKNGQSFYTVCQSGKILPDLVTLAIGQFYITLTWYGLTSGTKSHLPRPSTVGCEAK